MIKYYNSMLILKLISHLIVWYVYYWFIKFAVNPYLGYYYWMVKAMKSAIIRCCEYQGNVWLT